jgi:hypothetical protein
MLAAVVQRSSVRALLTEWCNIVWAFCVLKHPTIRAKISNIALHPEEENVCQLILKWTEIFFFYQIFQC